MIWVCHSSRKATISSWVRPTKFHHMTIDSPNGTPPSSISADRLVVDGHGQGGGPGRHVGELVLLDLVLRDRGHPGVDEYAVLVRRVHVEVERRVRLEQDLRAQQR